MTVRSKRSTDIAVATRKEPVALMCAGLSDRLLGRAAQWLEAFLDKRGLLARGASLTHGNPPLWVLETMSEHPVCAMLGMDAGFLDRARPESYILQVSKLGRRPVVAVIGRDGRGVRAGVARLVALLRDVDGDLLAPAVREENEPFIGVRRFGVEPTGRLVKSGPYTDTLWESWSDQRLRAYAEQIWLMGFNAIELAEIRGYRGVFSDDDLARRITPKIRTLMSAARDQGLMVYQFVWAQSLAVEGENLCWNDPAEREVMKREYDRLARTYGDLVDRIVVHVGDPGGCDRNGCDPYRTTQELAVELLAAYRRVNPKAEAVLSTWANMGFWRGAPSETLLGETYMPKEIGIALHRWYDRDRAELVRKSGRPLEIWSWYLGDFELAVDMTLNMRAIDAYYSALPDKVSRQVRSINSEICFHGLPTIMNSYVAAQKMWNPRRSLAQIEREFCSATFGDANADAMVALFQVCEKYGHPDRCWAYRPETDCVPDVFGTAAYNRELRRAVEMGESVKLGSQPRFTSATDPQALYDYLMRNARLLSVFSDAAERIRNLEVGSAEDRSVVHTAIEQAEPLSEDADYPSLLGRFPAELIPEEARKAETRK